MTEQMFVNAFSNASLHEAPRHEWVSYQYSRMIERCVWNVMVGKLELEANMGLTPRIGSCRCPVCGLGVFSWEYTEGMLLTQCDKQCNANRFDGDQKRFERAIGDVLDMTKQRAEEMES